LKTNFPCSQSKKNKAPYTSGRVNLVQIIDIYILLPIHSPVAEYILRQF
jgi:hypothetical protein